MGKYAECYKDLDRALNLVGQMKNNDKLKQAYNDILRDSEARFKKNEPQNVQPPPSTDDDASNPPPIKYLKNIHRFISQKTVAFALKVSSKRDCCPVSIARAQCSANIVC